MVRLFTLVLMFMPVIGFAHEIEAGKVSQGSHMMAHIMEAVFALSFAFCIFVVYTMFKDHQKKKTLN